MGTGFLKIQLYVGDFALHGDSVTVLVKKDGAIIHTLHSDENGSTERVAIECPDLTNNDGLGTGLNTFTTVDVEVPQTQGYKSVKVHGVQIFDGITSILDVQLEPIAPGESYDEIDIYVPREHGVDIDRDNGQPGNHNPGDGPQADDGVLPQAGPMQEGRMEEETEALHAFDHQAVNCPPQRIIDPPPIMPMATVPPSMNPEAYAQQAMETFDDDPSALIAPLNVPLANEVVIPDYITVHLGTPNAAARNVRVPFKSYIINVVCSEIYPFWEVAAIEANTHAIVSFTLNRLFTHWYRSQGRNFDITNNIQFDQMFIEGREIFQNVALIVDRIFNQFIRRPGRREPFFASYCNGTTSTCAGMSQHGSQALARQGFTPIQILRYYYPRDINIVQSTNFGPRNPGAYPGTALRLGSTGENVRRMQLYLNRISGNWWIPAIPNPNGVFGEDTRQTVIAFQRLFNLNPDGVIGPITWYEITRVYVAARNLAQLISEGQRYSIGNTPPTVVIRQGARGEAVVELQFLLNFIAAFYNDLPFVVEDGVFRDSTRLAVIEFQTRFGLVPDGVVGPLTWARLYEVYRSIRNTVPLPPPAQDIPPFPGMPLQNGSRSNDVRLMQQYLNAIGQNNPSIETLVVDGIFGPRTEAAVREYQRLFGLPQTGIIDRNTWYSIVEQFTLQQGGGGTQPPPPPPPLRPPYPGTLLRIGSRGENVRIMQQFLNNIARVYPIVPGNLTEDGIFGPLTQASVIAFQNFFGLNPDGIIGPLTWARIVDVNATLPNVTAPRFPGNLQVGSRGENVQILQGALNDLVPFYPTITRLNVDGIFGPITQGSVTAFQRVFGMTPSGIVNQTTWNLIMSMRNLLAPATGRSVMPIEAPFAASAMEDIPMDYHQFSDASEGAAIFNEGNNACNEGIMPFNEGNCAYNEEIMPFNEGAKTINEDGQGLDMLTHTMDSETYSNKGCCTQHPSPPSPCNIDLLALVLAILLLSE